MATLHKFDGTADVFLTTPPMAWRHLVGLAGKFPKVKALPGLNYGVSITGWQRDQHQIRQ
jgi:hypothetical protein